MLTVPYKIKIASYQQFTSVNASASFTVTTSYPIAPLVNSSSSTPYYQLIAHAYDVTKSLDLGVPTAINFSSSELTFAGNSSAGTTDTIDVFYLSTAGSVQVYRQTGSANSQKFLLTSGSLATINTLDPYNYESAEFFDQPYFLMNLDQLVVYVNSPTTVVMNSIDPPASLNGNYSIGVLDFSFEVYSGENDLRFLAKKLGIPGY
ncbi:MAG: hypothetical protein QXE51_02670 [Nitrososphaeria archaeon]